MVDYDVRVYFGADTSRHSYEQDWTMVAGEVGQERGGAVLEASPGAVPVVAQEEEWSHCE